MVKNILITMIGKWEHLGDDIMKTVLVEPVYENMQDLRITICCNFPSVYKHNPLVYEVIDGSKIKDEKGAEKVLEKNKYDLIIEASFYNGRYFYAAALKRGQKVIIATHQEFRNYLRKIFNIAPPPYTDGDIPLVFPKIDEYVFALKVNGFNIKKRYFPRIFVSEHRCSEILKKLLKKGFCMYKDTYIFCENASDKNREWGENNFSELAKLLSKNKSQIIILRTSKDKSLQHYISKGIDKSLLFLLDTSLDDFFALLFINQHFGLNIVKGIISGDTGALHAAAAVNNSLDESKK